MVQNDEKVAVHAEQLGVDAGHVGRELGLAEDEHLVLIGDPLGRNVIAVLRGLVAALLDVSQAGA